MEFQCFPKLDRTKEEPKERYFLTASPKHFRKWKGDKKILIPFEKSPEQLNYVNEKLNIFAEIKFLSRCSLCNEKIVSVKREDVIDEISENVAKNINQFYQCPNCQRIYWQGGHAIRMINKLDRMGVSISFDNKGERHG